MTNKATTIDHDLASDTILIQFLDVLRVCDNSVDVVEICDGSVDDIRVHLSWGTNEKFDTELCEILVVGVSKILHSDTSPDTIDGANDATDGTAMGGGDEVSDTSSDATSD